MEAKLSEISVLARAALSLLEGEASPKTAEAATLLRRVAQRLEADAEAPDAPELAKSVAARTAGLDRSIADLLEPEIASQAAEPASK